MYMYMYYAACDGVTGLVVYVEVIRGHMKTCPVSPFQRNNARVYMYVHCAMGSVDKFSHVKLMNDTSICHVPRGHASCGICY